MAITTQELKDHGFLTSVTEEGDGCFVSINDRLYVLGHVYEGKAIFIVENMWIAVDNIDDFSDKFKEIIDFLDSEGIDTVFDGEVR